MWEMTSAAAYSEEHERRLSEGWEPFSVSINDQVRGDTRQKVTVVWLRRFRGTPQPTTVKS